MGCIHYAANQGFAASVSDSKAADQIALAACRIWKNTYFEITRITFRYSSIGMATVIVVELFVSLVTGWQKEKVDPKYLIPFLDRLLCCLPEKWRNPCKCCYQYKNPETNALQSWKVQNQNIVGRNSMVVMVWIYRELMFKISSILLLLIIIMIIKCLGQCRCFRNIYDIPAVVGPIVQVDGDIHAGDCCLIRLPIYYSLLTSKLIRIAQSD
ncbi:hypothetical protein DPMN_156433 [Dreissena polymorpha]|uniref:Uncharacterized protein n=1 Tax=Dreissena polymorpha TaxID=45954 RepID=A0A9D4FTL0_DREPO|nr:hypothetical protein DPMN_156433 [Dreissena polymorpha]